jgi:hypothetical protein
MTSQSNFIYVVKEQDKTYYAYQYVNGKEQVINLAEHLVSMAEKGYLAEITKTSYGNGREIVTIFFKQVILKGIY